MRNLTLKEACQHYVQYQKMLGKSSSTAATIERSLGLMIDVVGEDQPVDEITVSQIERVWDSDGMMFQETGAGRKPRAPSSIEQIRRNQRNAVIWFRAQGWTSGVPLPDKERRHLRPRGKRASSLRLITESPLFVTDDEIIAEAGDPQTDCRRVYGIEAVEVTPTPTACDCVEDTQCPSASRTLLEKVGCCNRSKR